MVSYHFYVINTNSKAYLSNLVFLVNKKLFPILLDRLFLHCVGTSPSQLVWSCAHTNIFYPSLYMCLSEVRILQFHSFCWLLTVLFVFRLSFFINQVFGFRLLFFFIHKVFCFSFKLFFILACRSLKNLEKSCLRGNQIASPHFILAFFVQ